MKVRITIILLFVYALAGTPVNAQQRTLKVLSYNVLKGLQGDTINQQRFTKWVNTQSPDIIFYQEMNGFTQKSLESFAKGFGHPYAVLSKESGYSVAITSRFPIVNAQRIVEKMWHGHIQATIQGIDVFAVHLSPFQYQDRVKEIKQILATASGLPKGSQVMIAGDFNSFQAKDSINYSAKHLLAQQKREQKNKEMRNLNHGNFDYSVTQEVTDAGYQDAVNLFSKQFDYTMPTKKYDAPFKQKIRIDYIWLNQELQKKVNAASVIYDDDTSEMSDHYPILLQLTY